MPRISRNVFVAAPPEEAWELANRFDKWHPELRETPGGPEFSNHMATIQVRSKDAVSCYVEGSADFTAVPELLHDLEDDLGDDVYRSALDKLATAAQGARG